MYEIEAKYDFYKVLYWDRVEGIQIIYKKYQGTTYLSIKDQGYYFLKI